MAASPPALASVDWVTRYLDAVYFSYLLAPLGTLLAAREQPADDRAGAAEAAAVAASPPALASVDWVTRYLDAVHFSIYVSYLAHCWQLGNSQQRV